VSEPVAFGQYELLEKIAEGGMAEVFRARSRGVAGFEKIIVLKRILPQLSQTQAFIDLLIREAKIASILSHANIVQIFDLGKVGDVYFIAMEYVHGCDLGQLMSRAARRGVEVSLPVRLWMVAETARGLDFAHRRRGEDGTSMNIVHRDISPQNVLVSYEGEVKLTDFGIARANHEELGKREEPGLLRGKYGYMSPEQSRGEPIDRRSDIFSLGVVLWELVASQRLFKGETPQATIDLVRAADVRDPRELDPALPDGITPIIMKALAKNPAVRTSSAGELHTELQSLLFRMGTQIGPNDVAAVMDRLHPDRKASEPNKIAVDIVMRALQDATGVVNIGQIERLPGPRRPPPPEETPEQTAHAVPRAVRDAREVHVVGILCCLPESDEEQAAFEAACSAAGGVRSAAPEGTCVYLFGLARASERAFEEAIRAGLEVRRRAEQGLLVHELAPPVAVLRRSVDVPASGSPAALADEALRDVHHLLEGAPRGAVRIPADVSGSVEGPFRVIDLGDGRAEVEGYRGRREREAAALRSRLPLLGRRSELRRVLRVLAKACSGQGQTLVLSGDAGAGKSRLLAELRALVAARGLGWHSSRAEEGSGDHSYGLIAGLVADMCGIEDTDDAEAKHQKVKRLQQLGLTERERRVFGGLFDLEYPTPEAPSARPRSLSLLTALRKSLHALVEDRPVVIALEDLQWADDPSRDLVGLLSEGLGALPVLLVLTQRPEGGLVMSRGSVHRLTLRPLSTPNVIRLGCAALGATTLAEDLSDFLVERSGGSPLFLEELCGALLRAGAVHVSSGVAEATGPLEELEVPQSLQGLVAARLAQASREERRLLRIAAVVGQHVTPQDLSAIDGTDLETVGRAVDQLVRRGLLVGEVGEGQVDFPGETWRAAVYASIEEGDRRRLHGRVAAHLERRDAEHIETIATTLAGHLHRAGDIARAVEMYVSGAEAAERRGDAETATGLLETSVELLLEDGGPEAFPRSAALCLRAGHLALERADPGRAARWFERSQDHAERAGQSAAIAAACLGLAEARLTAGAAADAVVPLEQALRVVRAAGDRRLEAAAQAGLGRALARLGEAQRASEALSSAAGLAEELGDAPLLARTLASLGVQAAFLDRHQDAERWLDRAATIAADVATPESRARTLSAIGIAEFLRGDFKQSLKHHLQVREIASESELPSMAARAALRAAEAQAFGGDLDGAVPLFREAAELAAASGLESVTAATEVYLGYLEAVARRDAGGIRRMQLGIKRLSRLGRRAELALGAALLGRAQLVAGSRVAANRAFLRAMSLAEEAHFPFAVRLAAAEREEMAEGAVGEGSV